MNRLSISSFVATEIRLVSEDVEAENFDLGLDVSYPVDESDDKVFYVTFTVGISSPRGFKLDVKYLATFTTSEPIDEKFKSSQFPIVNAPAIAYPYLRSFISNLTLSASYEPVILPTINFQALANQARADGK